MEGLMKAWRAFDPDQHPMIFPGDREFIRPEDHYTHRTYEEFVAEVGAGTKDALSPLVDEQRLHLGLLPGPFTGDPLSAKVVLLNLNPGFGASDYFVETHSRECRQTAIRNLRGDFQNMEFPFWMFDPRLLCHSGSDYWRGKFKDILDLCQQKNRASYLASLKWLSSLVATLELCPYHSHRSPQLDLKTLPSAQLAKRFVHETLLPKAEKGAVVVVCTRRVADWGLSETCRQVVCYTRPGEARSGNIGKNTRGGKAIIEILGLNR
ncbi:MAG: hypothetical protein WB626_05015 [Bacteroidota bacterium]